VVPTPERVVILEHGKRLRKPLNKIIFQEGDDMKPICEITKGYTLRNLVELAFITLVKEGKEAMAEEMKQKATKASTYEDALFVMSQYVHFK
jgi:hypothetical protein